MTIHDERLFTDREKKLGGFQKLLNPDTRQAVMVIRGAQNMGKTWLVSKMRWFCTQADTGIPVVLLDFHHPREVFQLQTTLGLVRLSRDKLNAPAYFQSLNETINELTAAPSSGAVSQFTLLATRIGEFFSEAELRRLAVSLDVDPENLPHDTKFDLAFGLIQYHSRRATLTRLLARLKEERPLVDVDWQEGLVLDNTGAEASEIVQDRNEPWLVADDSTRKELERRLNDAFFLALATLMADRHPIVFLIDSYEDAIRSEAFGEARRWIEQELLVRLRDGELNDVVVIITGRETPDLNAMSMDQLVVQTELEPFNEEYVRQYLEKRALPAGSSGLDIHTVVLTSGGIPGELAAMTDRALAQSQKDDPFFSDV